MKIPSPILNLLLKLHPSCGSRNNSYRSGWSQAPPAWLRSSLRSSLSTASPVKAVAAVIPADFNPIPNPDEVADVFHVPLNSFLEMSEGYTFEDKVWNPSALACSYRVHFFQHGDYKVRATDDAFCVFMTAVDTWGLLADVSHCTEATAFPSLSARVSISSIHCCVPLLSSIP